MGGFGGLLQRGQGGLRFRPGSSISSLSSGEAARSLGSLRATESLSPDQINAAVEQLSGLFGGDGGGGGGGGAINSIAAMLGFGSPGGSVEPAAGFDVAGAASPGALAPGGFAGTPPPNPFNAAVDAAFPGVPSTAPVSGGGQPQRQGFRFDFGGPQIRPVDNFIDVSQGSGDSGGGVEEAISGIAALAALF